MNGKVARKIRNSKIVTSAKTKEQRRIYQNLKKAYTQGKNKIG